MRSARMAESATNTKELECLSGFTLTYLTEDSHPRHSAYFCFSSNQTLRCKRGWCRVAKICSRS